MTTKKTNANGVNNSNTVANVENLTTVNVTDNTTIKGGVSVKFTLNDQTAVEEKTEKLDKNKVFAEVSEFFCPVRFDSSNLEAGLAGLVASGLMSEDTKIKTIDAARKEFFNSHAAEIDASEKMSFAEVLAKLQTNQTLYKKVLAACNVQSLEMSNYIDANCNVMIYRASQCIAKDGNERYQVATLKRNENGKEFTQPLFVELREQTTANILLAIRYYSNKQNAAKTLLNKITEYKRVLTYVFEAAKKAKENGFSLEQVMNEVSKVFAN